MQIPTDMDLTLDSIPASAPCSYAAQELVLTILFHPDTTRIGQRVEVPKLVGNAPWVLGRRGPAFQAPGGDRSIALEDGHISRRALQLIYNGKALTIRRFELYHGCNLELFIRRLGNLAWARRPMERPRQRVAIAFCMRITQKHDFSYKSLYSL